MLVKIENNGKVEFLNFCSKEVIKFIRENNLKTDNESGIWSNGNKTMSILIYDNGIINIKSMYIWYDEITMKYLTENYAYTEEQLDDMCKFSCSLPSTEEIINELYN